MPSSVSPSRPAERRRLESWKGIAQYLGRDVTTVRRWEKREGLPVHRHLHAKLGSIYAFTDEIDAWWRTRSIALVHEAEPPKVGPGDGLHAVPQLMPVDPPESRRPMGPSVWGTSLVLIAILVVTAIVTNAPGLLHVQGTAGISRVAIPRPAGVVQESMAISPDGKSVAFAGRSAGVVELWIQQLASQEADNLPGTAGASFPFWSPNGQHVGFFAGGRLKTIALATREIRDLAPAPEGLGGTWNDRGDLVFAPARGQGLMLTSANGGDTFALTKVAPAHRAGHAWPEFLPDGRHVLYTDYIVSLEYGIYVLDLDTRVSKRVVKAFSRASYSPGMGKDAEGFLLYAKDSLVAQPFDLKNLEVRGAAKPLADRVLQWGDLAHHADFTVSHEGTVIARTSSEERHRLVWIDRESGKITGEIGEPTYSSNPTLSTDGKTLAVTMHEDQPYRDRIWLIDTASGVRRPFTEGQVLDFAPIWFFDRVLFSTVRDRRRQLYGRLLDNGIEAKVDAPDDLYALDSVSRDESIVTFRKLSPATKSDVWAWRPRDPASTAFPVLTGPENEGNSRLSPDGRYLAYASDESGRFEVYIRTFPDATATWRVSVDGGADPKWNANGRELFFVGGDRQMMAASVFTSPSLRASSPKPLFDTHLEMVWMDTRNHYDVTPDGRRFVILRPESDRRTAPFAVIGNWQRHP